MSKQALISPNETPIKYISGWTTDDPPQPIYSDIENSCRIAEVEIDPFIVAPPLFWVDCEDNVNATYYYYNTSDKQIYLIPERPLPPI